MRELSCLQMHTIAFAAGFALDLLVGDPHSIPHPVRWIGSLIAFLDRHLLGSAPDIEPGPDKSDKRDQGRERRMGALTVLIVIAVTAVTTGAAVIAAYVLSPYLGLVVEAILTSYVLAATSLRRESMKVHAELAQHERQRVAAA